MNERPLGVNDEAFWTDPWENRSALSLATCGEFKTSLLIDGPSEVPMDTRSSIPLAVLRSAAESAIRRFPFETHGIVVAMRQEDGRSFVGTAHPAIPPSLEPTPAPEPPPSSPGGIPLPPPGEGFQGSSYIADLRQQLNFWQAGTYLIRVLIQDLISNSVTVQLIAAADTVQGGPVPSLGSPLADFAPLPQAPGIPEKPGISLAVGEDQVHGAFRLPLLADSILLLFTGVNWAGPFVRRLHVPEGEGDERTGQFSVGLKALNIPPSDSPDYQVYAFAGSHMAGPVKTVI